VPWPPWPRPDRPSGLRFRRPSGPLLVPGPSRSRRAGLVAPMGPVPRAPRVLVQRTRPARLDRRRAARPRHPANGVGCGEVRARSAILPASWSARAEHRDPFGADRSRDAIPWVTRPGRAPALVVARIATLTDRQSLPGRRPW
jgi:hypothetical protein